MSESWTRGFKFSYFWHGAAARAGIQIHHIIPAQCQRWAYLNVHNFEMTEASSTLHEFA